MTNRQPKKTSATISTFNDLAKLANYSLMDTLNCDPDAIANGDKDYHNIEYVPLFQKNNHHLVYKALSDTCLQLYQLLEVFHYSF